MYRSEATFKFLRALFAQIEEPQVAADLVSRSVLRKLETSHGQEAPQAVLLAQDLILRVKSMGVVDDVAEDKENAPSNDLQRQMRNVLQQLDPVVSVLCRLATPSSSPLSPCASASGSCGRGLEARCAVLDCLVAVVRAGREWCEVVSTRVKPERLKECVSECSSAFDGGGGRLLSSYVLLLGAIAVSGGGSGWKGALSAAMAGGDVVKRLVQRLKDKNCSRAEQTCILAVMSEKYESGTTAAVEEEEMEEEELSEDHLDQDCDKGLACHSSAADRETETSVENLLKQASRNLDRNQVRGYKRLQS